LGNTDSTPFNENKIIVEDNEMSTRAPPFQLIEVACGLSTAGVDSSKLAI
jgi:hypothetical protein